MTRVGVLGLARSGRAAAQLALRQGMSVYATDASSGEELRRTAAELQKQGAAVDVGSHSAAALAECDVMIVSPGIPPTAPILRESAVAGVPRISELEFASRALRSPMIAITGTNGKSTTTAMTSHILSGCGFTAPAAGNIGTPLSEIAMREPQPDWVVVEASSFQLADIDTFRPAVGVVTNLAPDHLDRYPDVATYYADKARLFDNADGDSIWVLNAEDEAVLALPGEADGARLVFRVNTQLGGSERGGHIDAAGRLAVRLDAGDEVLLHRSELSVMGSHNEANALAAAIAAMCAGASADCTASGLRTFRGLAHRLEVVATRDGIVWINDSKATNIDSTLVALRSMTRPTVLLLGGRHKGEPYTRLLDEIERAVTAVIAYGEAGAEVEKDLTGSVPVIRVTGGFEDVMAQARSLAVSGGAVLLSPACSSYDMFRNYEERGDAFRRLVLESAA
ncbi:MAG TPA: UDP-N-acetylmuramoyl-L-alanine--D-glutamate ligase [Longimicrobiales bacterium]